MTQAVCECYRRHAVLGCVEDMDWKHDSTVEEVLSVVAEKVDVGGRYYYFKGLFNFRQPVTALVNGDFQGSGFGLHARIRGVKDISHGRYVYQINVHSLRDDCNLNV